MFWTHFSIIILIELFYKCLFINFWGKRFMWIFFIVCEQTRRGVSGKRGAVGQRHVCRLWDRPLAAHRAGTRRFAVPVLIFAQTWGHQEEGVMAAEDAGDEGFSVFAKLNRFLFCLPNGWSPIQQIYVGLLKTIRWLNNVDDVTCWDLREIENQCF
jgi:hypothetical protein